MRRPTYHELQRKLIDRNLEVARLREFIYALAERCAGQSEVLAHLAAKKNSKITK